METLLKTKIKNYRDANSLTQKDLSDLVGVRRETIVNLENGKYNPSLKLAMDVAAVFGVPVEEVFYFEDQKQGGNQAEVFDNN